MTKDLLRYVFVKLVSFFVSLKVIFIVGLTIVSYYVVLHLTELLKSNLIESEHFAAIIGSLFASFATVTGVIIGLREAIKVADVFKRKVTEDENDTDPPN